MQMNRFTTYTLLMMLLFGLSRVGTAQCASDQRDKATKFLDLDFEGYRLGSLGHNDIWELTDENGDPPGMPIVVTKSYKISSESLLPDGGCIFTIRFDDYGVFTESSEGLEYKTSQSNEDVLIRLNCKGGKCPINLDLDHFKSPPHPGRNAVEHWLEGLEKIQKTPDDVSRIKALRSRISALR
jgi:hypothetical protein